MKKTLVALAVLAASGASFAQVAITGGVAMGWMGTTDSTGAQASGLGVDTATLDFAVAEDLGGGLKVTAHLGFDTITRKDNAVGGDTGMTIGNSSFTVNMDSKQYGDYLQGGNGNVSGTFNGFEGKLLGGKPNKDALGVSVPFGPVTLSVTEYESTQGLGLGAGSAGSGAAAATSGTGSRNTQYQIAYKSGALGADAAYKSYDSSNTPVVSATATGFSLAATPKSITRGGVSYDFGVAKVGAAISAASLSNGGTDTGSVISASMPLGAITLGAQYLNRNVNGTNTAANGGISYDFNQNGYGLELDYAFSKTTKVAVNYMNWQAVGSTGTTYTAGASTSNLTEIALVKSF